MDQALIPISTIQKFPALVRNVLMSWRWVELKKLMKEEASGSEEASGTEDASGTEETSRTGEASGTEEASESEESFRS